MTTKSIPNQITTIIFIRSSKSHEKEKNGRSRRKKILDSKSNTNRGKCRTELIFYNNTNKFNCD